MMPEGTSINKNDAIKGALIFLAYVYDTDSIPNYESEADLNRCIKWMAEYKMAPKMQNLFHLAVALEEIASEKS